MNWLRPATARMGYAAAALVGAALLAWGTAPAATSLTEVVPVNDQATVTLSGMPTGNVTVRLYVADADYADEGTMSINGNPVVLFDDSASAANDGILVWTTHAVPASYWHAGPNQVAFTYARRDNSYRVDRVQVQYGSPDDMAVVQMLKTAGRLPPWLDDNDEIRIRMRRNAGRVYLCVREDGSSSGRRFLAWSAGDQIAPDFTQPLEPVNACDKAFCFATDDATGTRDDKITQSCGASG